MDDVIHVELLEGWREAAGMHYAGIKIELAPGWKTYWRAPGDGGLPTIVDWEGSENLSDVEILWPRPQVFHAFGMRSVGYDDEVLLPMHLEAEDADAAINARINLTMGICKEVCVPVSFSLNAVLTSESSVAATPIRTALSLRPRKVDAPLDCSLQASADGYQLTVATQFAALAGEEETSVVELASPDIWISEPDYLRAGDRVTATVELRPHHDGASIDLDTLRMTVLTNQSAIELLGCD